ncbi:MAG: sulfotransferase domain-containing protein [Candidatus Babeliales bacterium]|nr:sulfotransferase domain-containing protein [Candidatus Babeliales bacterium]
MRIKYLFIISYISYALTISAERPVFFISIPKAGTHLLSKCLSLLTGKGFVSNLHGVEFNGIINYSKIKELQGSIIFHKHLPHNQSAKEFIKKANLNTFFIIRDPRDQIVSLAYWVYKNPESFEDLYKLNMNDLILNLIEKNNAKRKAYESINSYREYVGWINEPGIHLVRFENLIGEKGGGSLDKQIKEIYKILERLGLKSNIGNIKSVANSLWGEAASFREGKIGSWKSHFTSQHIVVFKQTFGQLLIDLGYEKDLNW